jgi:hypothetical protein
MTKSELVEQLRDPATKGRRGSIVWALREHDCSDLLGDLALCVLEGTFEEVQHAHDIMRALDYGPGFDLVRPRLQAAWDSEMTGWRREALQNCLAFCEPDT